MASPASRTKGAKVRPPGVEDVTKADYKPGTYDTNDHVLSIGDVARKFSTDIHETEPKRSRGLSPREAAARLALYGPNALTPPPVVPLWLKFLIKLGNPFLCMLNGAGILSIVCYGLDTSIPTNLWLGLILFPVTFGTAFMAWYQELATSRVTNAFKNLLPSNALVIRDGNESSVPAPDLVIGDVVRIRTGTRIPADVRLIHVSDFKVEMSSLTGETRPVTMRVLADDTSNVVHAHNIGFSSSLVISGEAVGIVTRTADFTMIGTIASLASGSKKHTSPMKVEVNRFVKIIGIQAISMAIVLAIIGFSTGHKVIDVLINAFIGILVANIPQGLPATVTSLLSLTCAKLVKQSVYVKENEMVEALGSTSVICSDKTGTLTKNLMSVEAVWCNRALEFSRNISRAPRNANQGAGGSMRAIPIVNPGSMRALAAAGAAAGPSGSMRTLFAAAVPSGVGTGTASGSAHTTANTAHKFTRKEPIGVGASGPELDPEDIAVNKSAQSAAQSIRRSNSLMYLDYADLLVIASVNNTAAYDSTDGKTVIGDASETALLRFCESFGVMEYYRSSYRVVHAVPFSSATKFSAVICESDAFPGQHLIMLKGAPEVVLGMCTSYLRNEEMVAMDAEFHADQQRVYQRLAGEGMRVLGFARGVVPARPVVEYSADGAILPLVNLDFIGMTGLTDPPKDGVPEAVSKCREAGIRVFMVTGDHPFTAEAIARQVNLLTLCTAADVAEADGVSVSEVDVLHDDRVQALVLAGPELNGLTQSDWDAICSKPEIVFARTTPQQKLDIVKNVQRLGNMVAVTGDGVNDAPALKQANIGVAMGSKNASDVARDAGDIILLDDNFASIVVGIEAGRLLFDNLKKTVAYTITHLLPEVFPIVLNLLFAMPLGLSSLAILTIDLGTEVAPAISLSFESEEANIMLRPPRTKKDRLMSNSLLIYSYLYVGMMEIVACFIAYILAFNHYGFSLTDIFRVPDYFTSGADDLVAHGHVYSEDEQLKILGAVQASFYFTLVTCQFFHIWMVRSRFDSVFSKNPFRNMHMNIGAILELAIMIIVIWVPGVSSFIGHHPPPAVALVPCLFFAAILLGLSEFAKHVRKTHPTALAFIMY